MGILQTGIDPGHPQGQVDQLTLQPLVKVQNSSGLHVSDQQHLPKTVAHQCDASSRPFHSPCSSAAKRRGRCCQWQAHAIGPPPLPGPEAQQFVVLVASQTPRSLPCLTEGRPHLSPAFTNPVGLCEMENLPRLKALGPTPKKEGASKATLQVERIGKKKTDNTHCLATQRQAQWTWWCASFNAFTLSTLLNIIEVIIYIPSCDPGFFSELPSGNRSTASRYCKFILNISFIDLLLLNI